MGWALVFPLATSFYAISFKGYCTRVLGLMTYKALPGRQVSITSSRLNAHLSLPTSKRLTVITCGAASAAAELVSNRNVRILFFIIFVIHQKGSRVASRLMITSTTAPIAHSSLVIHSNQGAARSSSCLMRGTRTYRLA